MRGDDLLGPPSLASTCLQWHRDVLVPVTPDHLGASCLERRHQGPLLRLLLQPVTDVLGPTELLSLLTRIGGHRPGGSNGWGRAAARAARLMQPPPPGTVVLGLGCGAPAHEHNLWASSSLWWPASARPWETPSCETSTFQSPGRALPLESRGHVGAGAEGAPCHLSPQVTWPYFRGTKQKSLF